FSFLRRLLLPPGLRLQPVCQPAGSVLEGNSSHKPAEAVRPIAISEKRPQYGTAEELTTSTYLRRDRELAEPAIKLAIAGLRGNKTLGVIKSSFKRERNIFCEEDFWSHTERSPIVEAVSGLAVSLSLEDKNRHDRKPVIRLKEQVFRDEQ